MAGKLDGNVTVSRDSEELLLHVDGESHTLDTATATALRQQLGDALTGTREYIYTSGERRADGSYVVARRGAGSAGHRKVFDDFEALVDLYESLSETFTADDLSVSGLTDSRRHIVLRHFVEHPRFECELESRQPLSVRKL